MENAIIIARIIGPFFVIVGLGFLFNLKNFQKVMEDFAKNSALIYMGGVMALFFGLLIVQFYNVWKLQWPLIITILGWMSLIKGVVLIVFPKAMTKWTESYQKNTVPIIVHLVIALALGIFLIFKGYLG